MGATVLFGLDLAVGAVLLILLAQSERVREHVLFHVLGLVVAVGVYAAMVLAALAEVEPDTVPLKLIIFSVVGGIVLVPFIGYLGFTYVRMLLGLVGGAVPATVDETIDEAEQSFRFGQNTRAVRTLRQVLETHPGNVRARVMLAEIQLKRGQYEKAVGSYRLAYAHTRSDTEFARLVFKAVVLLNEHLGDVHGATRELDLIRKRMPDTPEAAKAQEWIVRIMDEDAREG